MASRVRYQQTKARGGTRIGHLRGIWAPLGGGHSRTWTSEVRRGGQLGSSGWAVSPLCRAGAGRTGGES